MDGSLRRSSKALKLLPFGAKRSQVCGVPAGPSIPTHYAFASFAVKAPKRKGAEFFKGRKVKVRSSLALTERQ